MGHLLTLLVLFLIRALRTIRKVSFYPYFWLPVTFNLVVWACFGAVLLARTLIWAWRHPDSPDGGLAFVDIVFGVIVAGLWIVAICVACAAPQRKAWSKASVVGSLLAAALLLALIAPSVTRFLLAFPLSCGSHWH